MKVQEFLSLVEEYLEVEDTELTVDTVFEDLEEYGSLGVLSIIALVDDEFQQTISAADLKNVANIGDLMALIGNENFD